MSAKFLEAKKQKKIYQVINQTLNGLSDDDHKQKYYKYLISKGITIVSDIFERMDMDRKIIESLRKLQSMDGLTEAQYYEKKAQLMRKMTQKATKFLYEKEEKKQGTSLREMAAKKSHEEKIRKARSTGTETSILELSRRSENVSNMMTESSRSRKISTRKISSRKISTMNVSRKTSRIRISGKTSANSSMNVNNAMTSTFGTQVRRHQSSKIMDDDGAQ